MNRRTHVLTAWAAVVVAGPLVAAGSDLYGWTWMPDGDGNIHFVSINDQTGRASFLFAMTIPGVAQARDLTYDPTDGHFYGSTRSISGPGVLVNIDPIAQTFTTHTYSFADANEYVEGIEYLAGVGLVVSHGNTGGSTSLSVVSHSGGISGTSLMPLVKDQDHLGANMLGGLLHVMDTNHPPNEFIINTWTDPFGTNPVLTGAYGNGEIGERDPVELAIHPLTNAVFSSGFGELYHFDFGQQQIETIGSYEYPEFVWGIAVPAPSAAPLFGLGALAAMRRRPAGRHRRATSELS
ncbi:MAG: hypothetical protein IT435_17680 [Phycisphaerales bacterium]|nr:hypothetical protein [Phycisphaerales bacterium]